MGDEVSATLSVRLNKARQSAGVARFVPIALLCGAVVLWVISLSRVDLNRMTDLGLVSALPWSTFIALLLLTISFCLVVRRDSSSVPMLLLHMIILIVMLYGITTFVEQVPRFAVAWRHAGFVEYIMRTGQVDPGLDARFNWPIFFVLGAFLTQLGGFKSAVDFMAWSPVFLNLLYLGPLIMIFRSVTNDKRLIWLSAWFFFLNNWIGQDYFSPQGFNYFLFLIIVAIVLTWFKVVRERPAALPASWQRWGRPSRIVGKVYGWLTPANPPGAPSTPRQRVGLLLIMTLVFIVIASSHQLTPFVTFFAVGTLALFSRASSRSFAVLLGAIITIWISFMTVAYLGGHVEKLLSTVGQLSGTVNASVTSRLQGSPEHILVLDLRLLMTLSLWLLAFAGGIRRLRKGHWDLSLALLAVVPFLSLGLQDYGGEILLRVYLFGLPFVSFFSAALFYTTPEVGHSWKTTVAIGLVSIVLLVGFHFTRYGNERMDNMTPQEVQASEYLYRVAPVGSLLLAPVSNLPLRYENLEKFYYSQPTGQALLDVDAIAKVMASEKYPSAYLIVTASQRVWIELFSGLPPGAWDRFLQDLKASGKFRQVYSNDQAQVYMLADSRNGVTP